MVINAGVTFYYCNELIISEHTLSIHYLFKLFDLSVSGFVSTKSADLKKKACGHLYL